MRLCKLSLIIVAYFTFHTVWAQTPGAFSKEAMDLRAMLQAALKQNKQLQVQNDRLKKIWSGIENMCSAITPNFNCQCDKPREITGNQMLEHVHSSPNSNAFKKVRDLPPPSVEFYRHDNGKLVNSAKFNAIKEEKKPKKSPTSHGNPVYTVSLSPIAAVLKDLNIAPYVEKPKGRKPPAIPTPAPVDTGNHHIGMDLMQEMLGPQSHKNSPNDLFGAADPIASLLGPLMGPMDTGSEHAHQPQDHHGHQPHTSHGESPVVVGNQNQLDLFSEVNVNSLVKNNAHTHAAHNSHMDHGTPATNHKQKMGSQSPLDLMNEAGINSASSQKHRHVLAPNNISTKLALNELLAATERSIHEKQEKLMFGTGPTIPMQQALDSIPKKNEVHQHQTTKTRKNTKPKQFAKQKAAMPSPKPVPTTTVTTQATTTTPKVIKNVKLAIKAVSSEGLVTNTISVTVRYTAPPDHTTEWLQLQENGATTRTSGVRIQMFNPDWEYTSNMVFVDANATRHALFRLFGNNKSISIQFNLTELQLRGEQLLPNFMGDIITFNDTLMAGRNRDMEIDLEVRGSPSENPALTNTEIFFTGLNTTTRPPTVFEIVHFNSEGVSVVLTPRTKTTSSMKITLKRPYIDYGGILTVRLPQTVGGYLAGYYYGHMIRVLEFYTQEVIPFGNLGVYYLPKSTLVRDPSQSILCAAMGNPTPDVVILKVAPDGKERETLTETIMLDTVTNMKSLTLYADKPNASEGRYICRASIGSEVVDSTTEVVVVQPPEFDDIQTGVTSNTTDRVTISCKATGRPRPDLEMRLYEDHGPNLAKTGIYKTSLLTPNNSTAQLTLTVSPNDREIHTVVCVAKQNIPDSKEYYKQVVVFPKSGDYTNWYLYNRLQSMATGW